MEAHKVYNCLKAFNGLTAFVLGDVMVDAYLRGTVSRISPEAPVPVVNITAAKEYRLGGAANVAINLKALGATPFICGVVGTDEGGKEFKNQLTANGLSQEGILSPDERITTVKTRVLSGQQQMLRFDEEDTHDLSEEQIRQLYVRVIQLMDAHPPDVLILEDYDKGTLTPRLIEKILKICRERNIPVAVDPKRKHFLDYKGVALFKPNLKELCEGLNIEVDPRDINALKAAVNVLYKELGNTCALITLSEHGIYADDQKEAFRLSALPVQIADVSGAGDTVISVAALCLALGAELELLATLSNVAGAWVCEQTGVVPINKEELYERARQFCQPT